MHFNGGRGAPALFAVLLASLVPSATLVAQDGQLDTVGLCYEGTSNPELDVRLCGLAIDTGALAGRSLATLYARRGRALVEIARHGAARSDFDQALALNPLSADAHHGRGLAHHAAGNYATAIDDFDAALRLSPHFVEAMRSRATARLFQGDLTGAIRDYDAELMRVPLDDVGRILRGLAHYAAGNHTRAVEDLAAAEAAGYPYRVLPLWLYLARTRSGGDGRARLAEARAELDAAEWPSPLIDRYLDEVGGDAVIAAVASMPAAFREARMTEAKLFLGELALLRGDLAAARRHLAAAATGDGKRTVEWALARALVARLAP